MRTITKKVEIPEWFPWKIERDGFHTFWIHQIAYNFISVRQVLAIPAQVVESTADSDPVVCKQPDDDARDIAKALIAQDGAHYARVKMQHLVEENAARKGFL